MKPDHKTKVVKEFGKFSQQEYCKRLFTASSEERHPAPLSTNYQVFDSSLKLSTIKDSDNMRIKEMRK